MSMTEGHVLAIEAAITLCDWPEFPEHGGGTVSIDPTKIIAVKETSSRHESSRECLIILEPQLVIHLLVGRQEFKNILGDWIYQQTHGHRKETLNNVLKALQGQNEKSGSRGADIPQDQDGVRYRMEPGTPKEENLDTKTVS